jgi:L-amino acid N-acyltransferase YncA
MFATLRVQLPDREAITFIRRDNATSIQAHLKMGMREVGRFVHDGIDYVVVAHRP